MKAPTVIMRGVDTADIAAIAKHFGKGVLTATVTFELIRSNPARGDLES